MKKFLKEYTDDELKKMVDGFRFISDFIVNISSLIPGFYRSKECRDAFVKYLVNENKKRIKN